MPLDEYEKKRDFEKTTEPKPETPKISKDLYVIQEHHASHLHWDLRLELDGVLKSWALPKEPPTDLGTKRLAVETEDHPVSYATFEGEIPEGQYGAGTVKIWDTGTFELIDRKPDKLIVKIDGKVLNGPYVLLRAKFTGDPNNWLFFKKKPE